MRDDKPGSTDVFFDQVAVRFTRGNLKEEAHYYPFGLPMGDIGSAAVGFTPNRRKYQTNEHIKGAGLNWMNFHARQFDPQIGRFMGVDPLAVSGGQDRLSPYAAMGNEPVGNVDPGGMQPQFFHFNYPDPIPNPWAGFSAFTLSWLGINPNQSGYYNYGDYFNESADANAAAFYAQGMADLAKQIAAVRSRGVFTTESLEANAKLLDNMPEGSMVTFYSDGTFVVNFWARGSKSKDDGSVDAGANTSHLLAFGGGKGAVGGILGALGLDDPIGLIFMPGSLSDGMTPAQIMAETEEMLRSQQQYEDMVNWLSGNGWMLSKGGKQNVWPDQYGYPPNPATIDWGKSDSQLADELSAKSGDSRRGPGTPNNKAKKWFRDKRPR